jgi:hypothetical protein
LIDARTVSDVWRLNVKDRIQALGGIPAPMSAADFGQSAKTDSERFGQLIKTRNIRGD